ncbi:MAG: thiamine diphosphokinase [Lachnospiraceae bacterium]|nr:thiamine diphosphokinase [Lachnospiraceae bacterium]
MKRCVIVGGAPIGNYQMIKEALRADDCMVYCDSGLRHETGIGRMADLIVGDFDSHENPGRDAETIVLPTEKDDTDTFFAVKEMMRRGYEDFLLIGMLGMRMDHSLGNLSILMHLYHAGKKALLLDDWSEMEIVGRTPSYIADRFPFFSVINLGGSARRIHIDNAKYPLAGSEIAWDYQYGISNEPLPGETASVYAEEGEVLLIRIFEQ